MSSKKSPEERRLMRLKKELDSQQKKMDEEKAKLRKDKKEYESKRRQFQTQQKEFKNKQNKQKSLNAPPTPKSPSKRKSASSKNTKKLEADLADYKKRYDQKSKESRELKKRADQLDADIRILKRRLKTAGRGGDKGGDEKKIRQLQREVRALKKQLRLALKDLEKQKRYYANQLRRFKDDQEKWIRLQRDANKKKGIIIKYVFVNDIRAIKVYPKRGRLRTKIRIKTEKGDDVVVWLDKFDMATDAEIEADKDDGVDEFMEEIMDELNPKRKKRRKKGAGDGDGDTTPQGESGGEDAEEDEEAGEDDNLDFDDDEDEDDDDVKEDDDTIAEDEEVDDFSGDQINHLLTELHARTRDLHRVGEIYIEEPADSHSSQLVELLDSVKSRHGEFVDKLGTAKFDAMEEIPELNLNWQNEIFRIESAVEAGARAMNEANPTQKAFFSDMPFDGETLTKEKAFLVDANKHLVSELSGRIEDLTSLNDIYFHPDMNAPNSTDNRKDKVDDLSGFCGERHTNIDTLLLAMPPTLADEVELGPKVKDNNKKWRDLIYAASVDHEQGEVQAEQYVEELQQRTQDLEKVLKVVAGDEPVSLLGETGEGAQKRHMEQYNRAHGVEDAVYDAKDEDENDPIQQDNHTWQELLGKLKEEKEKASQPVEAAEPTEKDFKDDVIDKLLEELESRRKDLEELQQINPTIPEECDAVQLGTERRHESQKEELRDRKKTEDAADSDDKSAIQSREQILEKLQQDNKDWQDSMNKMIGSAQANDSFKQQGALYMSELEGRISDLLKLKNLKEKKEESNSEPQELRNASDNILETVKDRHKDVERDLSSLVHETDDKYPQTAKIYQSNSLKSAEVNNRDWTDAVKTFLDDLLGPMDSIEENTESDTKETESSDAAASSIFPVASSLVAEEKEPDMWWLDKDAQRFDHIDSIAVTDEEEAELKKLGAYLNRLFAEDDDVVRTLYTPQPQHDKHHILSAVYDGVLLCELMNDLEPGAIDTRAIYKPDPFDPRPIEDAEVRDNVRLLLATAKFMGLPLDSYDASTWMDPDKHYKQMQQLIEALHAHKLKKMINLQKHPELVRLADTDEKVDDVKARGAQDWCQRWMNDKLERPLDTEVKDLNDDTYNTVAKMKPAFTNGDSPNTFGDDPKQASDHTIDFLASDMSVYTAVKPADLLHQNKLCQELLAAEIMHNSLEKLSTEEKAKYRDYLRKPKKSADDSMNSWINSMLPPHLHVDDLTRDLSDGIVLLHLLDRIQPKVVKWKQAQKKIRHKFDKLANCNYAMQICTKKMNLPLVNVSGSDIVDGHQKFVHTLLWQIMRYHSTKKLSELTFGGKQVKDDDILQWVNLHLSVLGGDRRSRDIKGFKDRLLTTSIVYAELIKATLPGVLREDLIHWEIPALKDPRKVDEFDSQRLDNARLVMSILRREGADVFVLPEDLVTLDSKAVLSMFASIMTLALTKKNDDNADTDQRAMSAAEDAVLGGKPLSG